MKPETLLYYSLLALAACSTGSSHSRTTSSGAPVLVPPASEPSAGASGSAETPALRTPRCRAEQFVACESGPACTRKHGELLEPKTCHDRAADACATLKCQHGCNIHGGVPNEVHCAPNASSASNMQKCGGFSGWGCPENMTCRIPPDIDDAMGICVSSR